MKSIKELKNLAGKKILVRVDFNVPIKGNKILDDFRIKKALPTIKYLQKNKATIILISHLGDKGDESMKPVFLRLKKYIPEVTFIETPILGRETTDAINRLEKGSIVLLENLRLDESEKKNLPSFARAMSRYANIYVNDAFSVCHRAHASVVGLPKHLPSYAGFQLEEEVEKLSRVFNPTRPFFFMVGGAKFETKIPLIKKFLRKADNIFIGGALANNLFKIKGYEIGKSLVSEDNFQINSFLKNKNLVLPIDVLAWDGKKTHVAKPDEIKPEESIVDVGPETILFLKKIIMEAGFVLWNGPLGKYEDGFGKGTEELLKIISNSKAESVVGGGDTVSIISKMKIENKFSFISTGGGATLDFLSKETLPGIKALK
ncbi:MAG: phosphoglycerate kinase [Candidatus Pacebacteria bacterium]|jgi:phosphoglycerate kinase|nr:phosphoglycerate kinase [Candidatus Paceibacterota bacterium]